MNASDYASVIAGATAALALVAFSQIPAGSAPDDNPNDPASAETVVNPSPTEPPATTPGSGGETAGAISATNPAPPPNSPVPPPVPDMKVIRDPNDPANARREGYIPGSERPAAPRRPADTSAPASNGTLPPRPADTLQGRNEQAAEPTDQTLTTPTIIAPTAPIIESGTGLNASGSGSGNLGIRGNRTAGPDGRTGLNASGSASGNLGINRNVAPPPNGSTGLSPTGSATGNLGTRPSSSGSSTGLSPTGSAKGNLGIRPSQ